jgi:hypothetical protein
MTLRHGSATDLLPSDGTSPSARDKWRLRRDKAQTALLLLLHFQPEKLAQLARLNRHSSTTPLEVALVAQNCFCHIVG